MGLKTIINPNQDVFFLPCLCFCLFRVLPWQICHLLLLLLPSVFFRVRPWLCFRFFFCFSGKCFCFLAQPWLTHPALNAVFCFRVNLLLVLISVKFCVNPWQCLFLIPYLSVEESLRLKEKLKSLFQLRLIHYYHSGQTKYYLVRRTQMQP